MWFSISWTNRKEEETTRRIEVEIKAFILNIQEDGTEVLPPKKSTKSTIRSLQSEERRFLKKQKSAQARGSMHHHDNHTKDQQPRPTQPYSRKQYNVIQKKRTEHGVNIRKKYSRRPTIAFCLADNYLYLCNLSFFCNLSLPHFLLCFGASIQSPLKCTGAKI